MSAGLSGGQQKTHTLLQEELYRSYALSLCSQWERQHARCCELQSVGNHSYNTGTCTETGPGGNEEEAGVLFNVRGKIPPTRIYRVS